MSLSAFFWRYARRYLSWVALSLGSLVLFGMASGLMFALLPPLFDEVLLADGERPRSAREWARPRSGIRPQNEPAEAAPGGPLARLEALRDRLAARAGEIYLALQSGSACARGGSCSTR